jgi:phosphoribosylformylglycinamidine synthase
MLVIAGGVGTVRPQHAIKNGRDVKEGAHVIVLGGPAMLIGLGGGAASSNASGEGSVDLDFNSVQRGNPEMERRAQMVINTCVALGDNNPIAFIHDVGAGGLSNALPELVKDAGFGGQFELRNVENADRSMSPLQIWCCEAQERYVMIVNAECMEIFEKIASKLLFPKSALTYTNMATVRERCGFSDVGRVVSKEESGVAKLVLTDRGSKEYPRPIDLPMSMLFPKDRKLHRVVTSRKPKLTPFDPHKALQENYPQFPEHDLLRKAIERVFSMPAVGSKAFLITIGDRTVGGMTVRDQMVGPFQTPVADVAVTITSLNTIKTGEAMAMGEKPILALISPAASARMAVAESLLNIAAAHCLGDLPRIRLSANWMAAVNHPGEGAALYEAVHAIGMELCPQLGISIPVGKDSTSMKATWKDQQSGEVKSVTAPTVSIFLLYFYMLLSLMRSCSSALFVPDDPPHTFHAAYLEKFQKNLLSPVFPDCSDLGLFPSRKCSKYVDACSSSARRCRRNNSDIRGPCRRSQGPRWFSTRAIVGPAWERSARCSKC